MANKIKILSILVLVLAFATIMTGCETFDYTSSACPSSSGCNAIYYCGQPGCAGYSGGRCNCN